MIARRPNLEEGVNPFARYTEKAAFSSGSIIHQIVCERESALNLIDIKTQCLGVVVSIHAPLAESDRWSGAHRSRIDGFNPRPSGSNF
jgi:hypothetical protein